MAGWQCAATPIAAPAGLLSLLMRATCHRAAVVWLGLSIREVMTPSEAACPEMMTWLAERGRRAELVLYLREHYLPSWSGWQALLPADLTRQT